MTSRAEQIISFAEEALGYRLSDWQKRMIRNGRGAMTLHRRRDSPKTRVRVAWVYPFGNGRPLIHKGGKP